MRVALCSIGEGDRIAKERFIYDSATAWQPVSSPDNLKGLNHDISRPLRIIDTLPFSGLDPDEMCRRALESRSDLDLFEHELSFRASPSDPKCRGSCPV